MRMILFLSLLLLSVVISLEPKKTKLKCNIPPNERQDCGFVGLDQKKCEEKGCCFLKNNHGSPWCFNGTKVKEDDSKGHQVPPKRDEDDDRHHPKRERDDDVHPKRRNMTHDHYPEHHKKEEEDSFHPKRRNATHDHHPEHSKKEEEKDEIRPRKRNATHDHHSKHPKKEEEKNDEIVGYDPKIINTGSGAIFRKEKVPSDIVQMLNENFS